MRRPGRGHNVWRGARSGDTDRPTYQTNDGFGEMGQCLYERRVPEHDEQGQDNSERYPDGTGHTAHPRTVAQGSYGTVTTGLRRG